MSARARPKDWCILRTNGAATLRLAKSLNAVGIEAWTPEKTVTRRKMRSRARAEVQAAILPTFVFVRASHLAELLILRTALASPHPSFSLFRHFGRVPIIADREIASLRAEEELARRSALKRTRRIVPIGSRITVSEGAFAGLTGVVEESNGKAARVSFGGNFSVSIATWLLPDDAIERGSSKKGSAA